MKFLLACGVISLILSPTSFAATTSDDALHLAGNYQCYGYDSHDGGYAHAIVTLTVNSKNSDFQHNYGAYHFQLTEPNGGQYTGAAAASGNNLAIYFKSTSTSKVDDQGIGIAVVTHDKNAQGKVTTAFHKFYYEPKYQGGGNGYETCLKEM